MVHCQQFSSLQSRMPQVSKLLLTAESCEDLQAFSGTEIPLFIQCNMLNKFLQHSTIVEQKQKVLSLYALVQPPGIIAVVVMQPLLSSALVAVLTACDNDMNPRLGDAQVEFSHYLLQPVLS